MLYRVEDFEPLAGGDWDEERARAGIRALVADAAGACRGDALWPAGEWDAWGSEPPLANLYVGAAGVVWALDLLQRGGYADVPLDLPALALRALERSRASPELTTDAPPLAQPSMFIRETGPTLVAWLLAPSAELADALHELVRANVDNPARELMWGSPGTMVAARVLFERTGEQRWDDVWRESAERLLAARDEDGLWTQELAHERSRGLGPPHGFAGIAAALAQGGVELDAAAVARRFAVVEDGLANWPPVARATLPAADGEIRLQWCYGGAGVVAHLAPWLDEELLLGGAELVWRAGGHRKGPMLCHGTAGNGYALLKTFARTGDELWLERARRFGMHALAQAEALPPRYALWTGGIGVAVFLASCIEADARVPTLDRWR